jgi:DNA-binding response OmpR family regulator
MQTAIADTLSELDSAIHVQPAGSLGEALKQLSQEQFDLVVLDLALPDTVGFEGLKRLRGRHPEVSVVVCSGRMDLSVFSWARRFEHLNGFRPWRA